jgi:hypothetical protein
MMLRGDSTEIRTKKIALGLIRGVTLGIAQRKHEPHVASAATLRRRRNLCALNDDYVIGLQSLRSLRYGELNSVALVERLESLRLNGTEVYEHVAHFCG